MLLKQYRVRPRTHPPIRHTAVDVADVRFRGLSFSPLCYVRARPPPSSPHCKPGTAAFYAVPVSASTARAPALTPDCSRPAGRVDGRAACCDRRHRASCVVAAAAAAAVAMSSIVRCCPRGGASESALTGQSHRDDCGRPADRQLEEQLSALYHLSLTRSLTHSVRLSFDLCRKRRRSGDASQAELDGREPSRRRRSMYD